MALKTMGFYDTDETRLVTSAIQAIAKEFSLPAYTFGIDVQTEDVLVFFPCEYLDKMNDQEAFITKVKEAWKAVGFQIKEEEILKGYTYLTISFPSLFFRLKPSPIYTNKA